MSSPSKSPKVVRKSETATAASSHSGIEEKVILETEIDELVRNDKEYIYKGIILILLIGNGDAKRIVFVRLLAWS